MIYKKDNLKIMIAGAAGMVGSAIKRAYLRKLNSQIQNNFTLLTPTRSDLDFSIYSKVDQWFKKNKPDIVIIAAAKVGGIYANQSKPFEFILDNLKIQTNLIEISYKYRVKKLLFLGSSCIYPKFSSQPIEEECLLNGRLEITNQYYAIAKIAGIKLCEALAVEKNFNAISLMPTNLYGPGDNYNISNSHVMPALIKKIIDAKKNNLDYITCWGTGKPLREFLFVDDLAEACLFALENWNINEEKAPKDKLGKKLFWLNVGSNNEISIKDLAYKISNLVGFKGNIFWDNNKPDGTPRKILNSSRINQLGWRSKVGLEMGIKLTIKSYLNELSKKTIRN